MRDLYATTLQLVHIGGGDPYDLACRRALEWAWRVDGAIPDLSDRPNGSAEDVGADVEVSWTSVGASSARSVEIRLQHPDENDSTIRWQTSISVSKVQGATRFTLRLGLKATMHSLRPWRISLRAPSVVSQQMQPPLLAYAGTMELQAGVRAIDAQEAETLAEEQLEADGKALPTLVISSSADLNLASAIARAASGLIQVVRLRDKAADDMLRSKLSRSGYTVPSGGMRLYWPGFGSQEQPHRHPYWTAAQLRAGRRNPRRSVVNQVVNLLAPISTARVPPDPGVLRARQEWIQERLENQRIRQEATRERARRQRESARRAKQEATRLAAGEKVKHLEGRLSEVEALLDMAETERDEANDRAKVAEEAELRSIGEAVEHSERADALKAEISDLRKNLQAMSRFERMTEDSEEDETIPEDVDSWGEVARCLDDLEGPGFCLTAQARACANGKGRYPYPGGMWKGLRALERVGRAYNEMGAELGMRFDQFAFEQEGLTVALRDRSYEDSWFEFEGHWHQRLPHVKLDDAKSPNEVGRIYFALDKDGKRVIVDWFGTKPDRPLTKRSAKAAA